MPRPAAFATIRRCARHNPPTQSRAQSRSRSTRTRSFRLVEFLPSFFNPRFRFCPKRAEIFSLYELLMKPIAIVIKLFGVSVKFHSHNFSGKSFCIIAASVDHWEKTSNLLCKSGVRNLDFAVLRCQIKMWHSYFHLAHVSFYVINDSWRRLKCRAHIWRLAPSRVKFLQKAYSFSWIIKRMRELTW